ncbi:MAG: LacI family transcriptional regulator [Gemmatimonadetes bacterium]|nr:LacI family transcriptional regulator [Gemmatimonadota bacterium]
MSASVTIRDVAREAGVSIATVSRVINGAARVTDDTRARVREVVERMGYIAHPGAVVTRRARTLAVLLPELTDESHTELLRGIEDVARSQGVVTLFTHARRELPDSVATLTALRGRVDGVLAVAPTAATRVTLSEIAERTPLVVVNGGADAGSCAGVSADSFQGASAMMQHLLALGHRRIAFLRGPAGHADAALRLHAVREVANWFDGCRLVERLGDFRMDAAYQAVTALLRDGTPHPDAVFAANDVMAWGAMAAVRDAGLSVPGDIAVVGFDELPMTPHLSPPLTTVRLPAYDVGLRAVQRLADALRAGATTLPADHERLPATLVVRESCGSRRPPTS